VLKNLKLRTKLFLLILLPVVIVITVVFLFIGINTYTVSLKNAENIGRVKSLELSYMLSEYMNEVFSNARSISGLIQAMKENNNQDRSIVNMTMKKLLEKNAEYFGIYALFEPDSFDGIDREYALKESYDETGVFSVYHYRDGSQVKTKTLDNYSQRQSFDWYWIPYSTKNESIIEPYLDTLYGKKILMTTVAVPVLYDGKSIGVVGIDLTFDKLISMNKNISLYKTGFGRIMTNSGTIVAHPQEKALFLPAKEIKEEENFAAITERMNKNEVFSVFSASQSSDKQVFASYVPVFLGNSTKPWIVGVIVERSEMLEDLYSQITVFTVSLVVAVSVIMLVIIIVSVLISRSVSSASKIADSISNYNLRTEIPKHFLIRKDEIGVLINSLNKMQQELKVIVRDISEKSETVDKNSEALSLTSKAMAASSEDLAVRMQHIAQGASDQAQELSQIVKSLEEFDRNMEKAFCELESVGKESRNANEKAVTGKKEMDSLIGSIEEIKKAFETVNDKVQQLQSSVGQISGITQIISSITEQTNLLALNAAIEAARAGEAGKGFSVVADEIRKLAEESKASTVKIVELVSSINSDTGELRDTSKKVEKFVNQQTLSVENTVLSFAQILTAVQNVDPLIQKTSSSMDEIARSKEEILEKAEKINTITQENSASTEEASSSSQELSASSQEIAAMAGSLNEVADRMIQTVKKFNT
jgi:methyl-accepting chemotaxis protein